MIVSRSSASAEEQQGADPRRWKALSVCLVAGFMTLLDVSIVNVALPAIRTGLAAPQSTLQWVVSGYALAFGLVLVPAGRFGDVYGRRTVFVFGVALFTLASAAAGIAADSAWLVAARLVQGVAGGVINPQVSGLIQQLFRGAERGRAFGLLGATIGVSTAIGPLLGGLLIHLGGGHDGWRLVFYVNVPVGILAVVLAYRYIGGGRASRAQPREDAAEGSREKHPREDSRAGTRGSRLRRSMDPVGVLLLGTGLVLVLLPFVEGQQWHGPGRWLLALAGLTVIGVFTAWERRYGRHAQPVVDLSLFRRRSYALGTLLAALYFAGFTAIFFILTLYLQNGLGYSALEAGLATTPFAAGSAAASVLGGRIVTRLGRPLVVGGLLLVGVALGVTALATWLVPGEHVAWATAVPLLLAGLGSGLVISPNQTLTLSEVPVAMAGAAGGVLQTGQRVGAAVGIAAIGSVFFAGVASSHGDHATAFRHALLVTIAFVLAALAVALADVVAARRASHRVPPAEEAATSGSPPAR
ncbi:MFS family permease [Streptosporangium becharense]|uniref:MFS family permease n=1 Tax=Streptosporangium becharense TaxID=1816182 RepID=A0A7W9ICH7_9ACTN|nr:MFS transporter [Streptosporangium becharense]MBB2913635.1 MFS family permease [Streptosporangium becharense]MBB5817716.1 MFS family permease [Streptosporangium becharense]